MASSSVLPLVVAIISLVGVLMGVLASLVTAGRTTYINSITVQRSKWIETLRSNLVNYQARVDQFGFDKLAFFASFETLFQTERHLVSEHLSIKNMNETYTKLQESLNTIRLQLNPRGEIDGAVLQIVEILHDVRMAGGAELQPLKLKLVMHSQWLLKVEWEKVKFEARGLIYQYRHRGWHTKLIEEYRAFAASTGAYEDDVTAARLLARKAIEDFDKRNKEAQAARGAGS